LLIRGKKQRRFKDVFDKKLIGISFSRPVNLFCHVDPPYVLCGYSAFRIIINLFAAFSSIRRALTSCSNRDTGLKEQEARLDGYKPKPEPFPYQYLSLNNKLRIGLAPYLIRSPE
jgi:hypothetical protein